MSDEAPLCYKCKHPNTKEKGRPMEKQGTDTIHKEVIYECNSCGRIRTRPL